MDGYNCTIHNSVGGSAWRWLHQDDDGMRRNEIVFNIEQSSWYLPDMVLYVHLVNQH